jgi:hypothetical protein
VNVKKKLVIDPCKDRSIIDFVRQNENVQFRSS